MQPQRPNRLLAGDGHRQQIPPRSANLPDRKDMDLFFGERRHTASSQDLYTGAGVFQAAMTNTPGGAVGGAGLNENLGVVSRSHREHFENYYKSDGCFSFCVQT